MCRVLRILGLAGLLVLGAGAMARVKNPNTIVHAQIGDWPSFDPAWAYDSASWDVLLNTYNTLVFPDSSSNSTFVPHIATTVPSKANGPISADGLTYKFPIRQGIKFQNGDPLTAQDVVYSMRRMMVMDTNGGPAWMLLDPLLGVGATRDNNGNRLVTYKQIEDSVYADGNTVVFKLKKSFAPFLNIMASEVGAVLDMKWAVAHGEWNGTAATWNSGKQKDPQQSESYLNNHINGSGPFALERYVKGKQVVLKRYDGYWQGPAKIERVADMRVGEYSTRKLMLQNGDADIADISRQFIPEVEQTPGVTVQNVPRLAVDAIYMNEKINTEANNLVGSGKLNGNGAPAGFFASLDIRKAFAYSFDFKAYIT